LNELVSRYVFMRFTMELVRGPFCIMDLCTVV